MKEADSIEQIALPDILTIRRADDLQRILVSAITRHASILVDCSAIKEADLSAVQLLLAAQRSAAAQGRRLALAAPVTGALLSVLERGGILAPNAREDSPGADFWLKAVSAS